MKIKTVFLFVCIPVILLLIYWIIGYTIISNPGFLLKRSEKQESIARQIIACKKFQTNAPQIYILPKKTLGFFIFPYDYLGKHIGREQNYTSFIVVENGTIVLQEDSTDEDLFHELGHFTDYSSDPDGYTRKTFKEKEVFASDFAVMVREECQY